MKKSTTIFFFLLALATAAFADGGKCRLKVALPQKMAGGATAIRLNITLETERGEVAAGDIALTADDDSMLVGMAEIEAETPYCAAAIYDMDPHLGFSFIAEEGTVTAGTGAGRGIKVSGTPLNDALAAYNAEMQTLGGRRDNAAQDSLTEAYMRRYAGTPLFCHLFCSSRAVMTAEFCDTKKEVERLWNIGSEKQRATKYALNTYRRICQNSISNGMKMIDVEIPNATADGGKTVRLSDYIGKGRWVMIDFWASWCVGCRQAIPFVKQAYEEVKDKNVTFISIAEWDKRPAALKAIAEEDMPWLQLIDEKGRCGEAYMFSTIPRLMLFAPDGTLAETNLYARGLSEILRKAMSEQPKGYE